MKLNEVDLQRTLDIAREMVGLTGDVFPPYRHRNGSVYTVLAVALREEDLTPLVIYRGQHGGPTWARPLPEFLDGRFTKETE